MKKNTLKFLGDNKAIIIAMLCLILSLFTVVDDVIDFVGRGYIHDQATTYLKDSEVSAGETFLILSTAKAGLAIVESSEGGITFVIEAKVQLGRAFEVLKELINRSWEISFLSLTILFASQIILDSANALAEPLFILLAATALIHLICRRMGNRHADTTSKILRSLATGVFVLIFALPISIFLTSLVSKTLMHHYSEQANSAYIAHNELFQHGSSNEGLKESSHTALNNYKTFKKDIHGHVKTMHTHVYRHMAIVVLETLILPFLILSILYVAANSILKRPRFFLLEQNRST